MSPLDSPGLARHPVRGEGGRARDEYGAYATMIMAG